MNEKAEAASDAAEGTREAELMRVAKAALARFGFPEDAALTPVCERENAIFRIDDPSHGKRFALRLHRPRYQTLRSVRSELQWMKALRDAGVHTPEPLAALDGDLVQPVRASDRGAVRLCDVFAWIDGTPLADTESRGALRVLGALNARIHRHARGWKLPEGFERQRWDEKGILGPEPIWGRYQDLEMLEAAQRRLLDRAAATVRGGLESYGKTSDRFGLIHADLMPENVLVEGADAYVIDFDDSGFGWFMYDIATLLAYYVGSDTYHELLAAWLEGYNGVEPLAREHVDMLPTLIMARLLVGLGWLHTRRNTDFARSVTGTVLEMACAHAERILA